MMFPTPAATSSCVTAVPAAPTPRHDHLHILKAFADDLQRVEQCSGDHYRGAVLIVVEDRDVESLGQAALDLETTRGGDVLEVDAAKDRARR